MQFHSKCVVAKPHLQILGAFSKTGFSKMSNVLMMLGQSGAASLIANDVPNQMSYSGIPLLYGPTTALLVTVRRLQATGIEHQSRVGSPLADVLRFRAGYFGDSRSFKGRTLVLQRGNRTGSALRCHRAAQDRRARPFRPQPVQVDQNRTCPAGFHGSSSAGSLEDCRAMAPTDNSPRRHPARRYAFWRALAGSQAGRSVNVKARRSPRMTTSSSSGSSGSI